MYRYTVLLKFTDQGLKKIDKSTARAGEFEKLAKKAGVAIEGQYWTIGGYDGLLLLAAKSEEKILQLITSLAALGNVRTETLRTFTGTEYDAILKQ